MWCYVSSGERNPSSAWTGKQFLSMISTCTFDKVTYILSLSLFLGEILLLVRSILKKVWDSTLVNHKKRLHELTKYGFKFCNQFFFIIFVLWSRKVRIIIFFCLESSKEFKYVLCFDPEMKAP